jgi:hypothetical protein
MNDHLRTITIRGRVVVGFAILAIVIQFVLEHLGVGPNEFNGLPILDRTLGDRVFLITEWMALSCLLVWTASEFRVSQAVLFHEKGRSNLLIVVGVVGLVVLSAALFCCFQKPYSGEAVRISSGWQLGVGWFLVWWYWVFRR